MSPTSMFSSKPVKSTSIIPRKAPGKTSVIKKQHHRLIARKGGFDIAPEMKNKFGNIVWVANWPAVIVVTSWLYHCMFERKVGDDTGALRGDMFHAKNKGFLVFFYGSKQFSVVTSK